MNGHVHSMRSEHFDGFNVLSQAILFGARIKIMPGQLLLVKGEGDDDKQTAFVHSVALSTRLSTVTFILQKRFRRAIHERKRVPVPPGATFSYFAEKDPIKYANRIGYPVVVKEVFGENPSYAVYDVKNRKQLAQAIKKVKAHLPTTGGVEPASYAQTINLSSAEVDEDGRRVKSDKARFLIEKQIIGDHYRVYVVAGKYVATLQRNETSSAEVDAPSLIKDLAERAVTAISGLMSGTVDIVHDTATGAPYVVELSERIVIPEDYKTRLDFCDKVFSSLFLGEAKAAGMPLRTRREKSIYDLSFHGITSSSSFIDALSALASKVGVSMRVKEIDNIGGGVSISLKAEAVLTAVFVERAFLENHISSLTITRQPFFKGKLLAAIGKNN